MPPHSKVERSMLDVGGCGEPSLAELPRFCRSKHLRACFGFTKEDLRKLVAAGVFTGEPFMGCGNLLFRREQILAAVAANRITRAVASPPARMTNAQCPMPNGRQRKTKVIALRRAI